MDLLKELVAIAQNPNTPVEERVKVLGLMDQLNSFSPEQIERVAAKFMDEMTCDKCAHVHKPKVPCMHNTGKGPCLCGRGK